MLLKSRLRIPGQKNRGYFFTLLEIMVGIVLLAIIAGAVFWRLDQMVARNRFDSDVNHFRGVLLSTRSLAINTGMDFRWELQRSKAGWRGRLVCREDSDLIYPLPRWSNMQLSFDEKPINALAIDFYSSGLVGPKGLLTLSQDARRRSFSFPAFFYPQEGVLPPLHPSELD